MKPVFPCNHDDSSSTTRLFDDIEYETLSIDISHSQFNIPISSYNVAILFAVFKESILDLIDGMQFLNFFADSFILRRRTANQNHYGPFEGIETCGSAILHQSGAMEPLYTGFCDNVLSKIDTVSMRRGHVVQRHQHLPAHQRQMPPSA
jgi:hypothetical protein